MTRTIFILFTLLLARISFSKTADSTQTSSTFSGTIGITTNGFSIIPTFSLNSPAAIINLSWQKKRFSFDPDIRLVSNASKGGLLFWSRYRLIDRKKFSLRVGAHPALSLIRKQVLDDGINIEITEALRFVAFEVVPNYQITENWGLGAMYLEGHGLQKHGPQTTRVLFLSTSLTNLKLSPKFRCHFIPTIYFLNTDGFTGSYLTATSILAHQQIPFSFQATINQTFVSDIPGNQDFMWNITLNYSFKRKIIRG
ncbi:MAG: hypothetical protein R2822_09300 [Spirosomataceae bacterium]